MAELVIGKGPNIDLPTLIDTRLLVQANSGGGKSWLLRRFLEQSHGQVQQIVIDLEGEFSTLREQYDYILAGKDGDTPAEPRSAAMLARRLLELNVSAIVDLYELSHQDRKRFVRLFLSAMVNAPKSLWHPCIVVIDEAHVFAPQTGTSEAMESVIDLATRGRKRGYCAVLATQRISKLHKDAVAEMNNKLIGRTGLDIDRKRAAEELGFTSKESALALRTLAPGHFYAFGPAISEEVVEVEVGKVKTSHPKAGDRILTKTTPPTAKIKAVLGKLADLPAEAQKEADTVDELKSEVKELTRKLRVAERAADKPAAQPAAIKQEIKTVYSDKSVEALKKINRITNEFLNKPQQSEAISKMPVIIPEGAEVNFIDQPKAITGGALRMLQVMANRYPMRFTKSQLALLSKMSPRGGSYNTYLSRLRSSGYISEFDNLITISEDGLNFVGAEKTSPQTQEEILDMWSSNLSGGAKRMFDYLVNKYPRPVTKEELSEMTDISLKGGSFSTYLSRLRSNSLITVNGMSVKASDDLFIKEVASA